MAGEGDITSRITSGAASCFSPGGIQASQFELATADSRKNYSLFSENPLIHSIQAGKRGWLIRSLSVSCDSGCFVALALFETTE